MSERKPPGRFLRTREVIERVGLSKSEIDRRRAAGTFPEPIREGHRTLLWPERDIEAWQTEREIARLYADLI